jgi:hypothetical protein
MLSNSRLDLKRWLMQKEGTQPEELTKLIEKCKNTDFLTFNSIIGLPKKNNVEMPIFDYEQSIIKLLESGTKYLWILKSVGLGISELCLRYILYMCMHNDSLKGKQVVILVGPSIGLAVKLMKRLRRMFEPHGITFDYKETFLVINGVEIECYPSHHLDSFRSLEHPKIIYVSEGDFFPPSEQSDVRHISERYIAKSDPVIIMESTPNNPGGLFDTISREPNSIYHKLYLDWSYGFGKIYSQEDIANARLSTSFAREMELQFLGGSGNVFAAGVVATATAGQYSLKPEDYQFMLKSAGLDWGAGSSKTALVILAYVPAAKKIRVIYTKQWERPDYSLIFPEIWAILTKFNVQHLYCDGSSPSNVQHFMSLYRDDCYPNYNTRIQYYKDTYKYDPNYWEKFYHVVPLSWSTEGRKLLSSFKLLVDNNLFESHNSMTDLHVAMRTATMKDRFDLDKNLTINHDLLDATIAAAREFSYRKRQ